jgi:archaellum biogenesis ATPase FlaH
MGPRLKGGKLYLDNNSNKGLSYDAFKELLMDGYNGIVVSTNKEETVRINLDADYDFKRLATKDQKTLLSGLDELEHCLNVLPRRSVVLLESLDKLIADNGYDETLSFIYRLRDRSYLDGHVVILLVDSKCLSKIELRLIEKETNGSRLKEIVD